MAEKRPVKLPKEAHAQPDRHRRALRSAVTLAVAGLVVIAIGVAGVWMSLTGWLAALVIVGVTMLLLSPVWYFTYMESLEPELYQHESEEQH